MPFMRDGKCVYKKNKDGSRGKKEGCSDSVEKAKDYLKALYANVDDATKKENKTMKIKKSELIALIKEEIMSEMYSDDPRMDDAYPEVGEAQKIVDMIMDMSGGDKAAAMQMLMNAMGMLQSEIDVAAEPIMENITDPATQQVLIDVAAKLAPLLTFVSLPVLIKALYDELRDPRNRKKRGDM